MADAAEPEPIRPANVHRAYSRVAAGFDAFVKAIPGYHAHLRMSTNRMGLRGGSQLRLLDVGCGTGASTAALLDAAPGAEVVAVDASTDMLAVARRKNWPPRVRFVQSRMETLAEAGVDGPFDGIFAAYLVSNLPDAEIGLRRLLTLLRPGAPLAVHDYAVADRIGSRLRWSLASWAYLIPLARMRCGFSDLQRYRSRKVGSSDGVEAMTHHMQRAGFEDVRVQTVSGWQQHIVYTFLGRRPDEPDVVGQRAAARAAAGYDPGGPDVSETSPAPPEQPEPPGAEDAGGPEDPGYADDPAPPPVPRPTPTPHPRPDHGNGNGGADGPVAGNGSGPGDGGTRDGSGNGRASLGEGRHGESRHGGPDDPDADTPPHGGPAVGPA